jgi:glucan phosphorylase
MAGGSKAASKASPAGQSIPLRPRQATAHRTTPHCSMDKLENTVIPIFYRDRNAFIDVMRHAIALNGSFFSTQRMILQYFLKAYC